ncbi:hypothetical protein Clacol_001258 [Clathrus columnatus]|uniref:LysM domain-containing protein n=1 Tax=Clathrus columnatus TaxID=1419009 RepID=A0AAV5A2U1_9AGAM|nr:hypothetical protein Clacol_001258 [Clathrus columnatus]
MPRFNAYLLVTFALSALISASPLRNYMRDTTAVPSNVAPGTITSGCAEFHTVVSGETCDIIQGNFDISNAAFLALNPEVNGGCTDLIAGLAYCVQATPAPPPPPSPPPSTIPPNVANGTIIDGCTNFFTISEGTHCSDIESLFNISDSLFHLLNPEVDSFCSNLVPGEAYCVAGSAPTTVPSNVATGTITTGCTQFFTAQPGNTCQDIEMIFGITSTFFTTLNPEIDAQCTDLIAGEAYCVSGSA